MVGGKNSSLAEKLDAFKQDRSNLASVAVRSSATAEDLPEASFAGQLGTFLSIRGEVKSIVAEAEKQSDRENNP